MSLKEVLQYIKGADISEINDLTMAAVNRYRVLFPEDEIFFYSLPFDKKKRSIVLKQIREMDAKFRKTHGLASLPEETPLHGE